MKSLCIFILLFTTVYSYSQDAIPPQESDSKHLITRQQSLNLITSVAAEQKKTLSKKRLPEFKAETIEFDDKSMRFKYLKFGDQPANGHSLFISMHGGGNGPPSMNDAQWKNQIRLYKPTEGYYVAPRAPTNTWNLWHEAHIDPMFDRLIENFIILKGVNPNKIYLTGYSAGGDGTYQLATRLADRFSAAAMMAGHPNETRPDNLYNLPFFIQMGGKDSAFNRNKKAKNWDNKLNKLAEENPGAYPHKTIIYPEYGHWMKGEDKVAIPWMLEKTRNPWPKTIVWHQDDVTVKRFYWLYNESPKKNQHIKASVDEQTITLETDNIDKITLRLNDELINLDKTITVNTSKGTQLFKGKIARTKEAIITSIKQRYDPVTAATALLEVNLPTEENK